MSLMALEVLGVLMRWVHIASAALLVGGVAFARAVVAPVLAGLPAGERAESWQGLLLRFRPLLYATMAGLLVSGTYNLLTHPGHSRLYLIWFAGKMLLAAHIFATILLMGGKEAEPKLVRRLSGTLISGLAVLLIGALLRRIF